MYLISGQQEEGFISVSSRPAGVPRILLEKETKDDRYHRLYFTWTKAIDYIERLYFASTLKK